MKFLDRRDLKDGRTRYRFKLSEEASEFVESVFRSTGYKYNNSALSLVCVDYLRLCQKKLEYPEDADGNCRMIIRVFPDEAEFIDYAFGLAEEKTDSSAKALVTMCYLFALFNK